jgi:hypothetical protein
MDFRQHLLNLNLFEWRFRWINKIKSEMRVKFYAKLNKNEQNFAEQ